MTLCYKVKAKDAEPEAPIKPEPESTKESKRYKIDGILAVVPSSEGNRVIMESSITQPAIDGTMRTQEDLIRAARLYSEAAKYGMLPSEQDIDEHLNMIKRENKLTHDDIVKLFDSAGYTFAEGREQLAEMSAINTLLSVKIHSRLLIPEREIRAYYEANPEYMEAQYELQYGVMSFMMNETKEEQFEKIEDALKEGKEVPHIEWRNPYWTSAEEIAEDRKFVTQMKPGEVRMTQELLDGFEFFKMLNVAERRLKTFEERYTEIADILRRPRYERLFSEFEQHLEATMPVIFMAH